MPKSPSVTKADLGNTEPNPNATPKRERAWTMTLNNYSEEEYNKVLDCAQKTSTKWIVGKEVGSESGIKHLQAYFYIPNKTSLKTLKRDMSDRAHFEVAKGSPEQNYEYCSKDGDFVCAGFDKKMSLKETIKMKLLKKYEHVEWRGWQKQILDIIKTKPDDRTINWVFDAEGNKGKSYLTKYLALIKNVIIADGKKDNVFNQVNKMLNEDEQEFEIVLLDIPRSSEGYVNYGVLEQLKNGLIYSGKYEGGLCVFDNVHVIVFANFMPKMSEMSLDRWNVITL